MLAWFRENAPIKLKLLLAVTGTATLAAAALACGWWVLWCFASASSTDAAIVSRVETGLSIASAAIMIVAIVTGRVLARAIAIPYVTTVVRMEALAAGDLDSPIEFTHHTDCVGRMTRAMSTFRENAMSRDNAEAALAAAETASMQAQRESEAAAIEGQVMLIVGSIGGALKRLAAGDFAYRLNTTLPASYEPLREDLNGAFATLESLLRKIASNIAGLQGGSAEIAQAADDLSRRTEQQAASLEQTAAALDEITATVQKTAENAQHAHDVVSATRSDAETSGQIVSQAVSAMDEIEKSSQQIGQIIGVIDEIAFQTNLLALNAGVEAARAGDAGRGFAVVASEVRALAQRSAGAAKEIKALVSTSSKQVEIGVKLVGNTGSALTRIVSQVAELAGMVSSMSLSAQEQAQGLREVNTAVNQMDQVTQQNAAMVEQTTAASHSLSKDAAELAGLTQEFQITEEHSAKKPAERPAHAPVPPRPAAVASRAAKERPAPRAAAPKKAAGTSASLALAHQPAEEDWKEF